MEGLKEYKTLKRVKLRLVIKLLQGTGTNVWDYTTLNICYPKTCEMIKDILKSWFRVTFNKHSSISVESIRYYLYNL